MSRDIESVIEPTRLDRELDYFLTTALSIHDVMRQVPHPYNAVGDMTNKWAHDFVNWAFSLKLRIEKGEFDA